MANDHVGELSLREVVGALIENDGITEAANSLKVKTELLDERIGALDALYDGTGTIDAVIAAHFRYNQGAIYSGDGSVYGNLNTLINSTVPKELDGKFAKAVKYKSTDDMLAPIIRTKVSFLKSGFRVTANEKDAEKAANEWLESRKIANSFIPQCAESIFLNDQSAVLWNHEAKSLSVLPLANLKIFSLHSINSDGSPKFITYMKLPIEIVALIKKLPPEAKELKNFPQDWIDAAKRGRKRDSKKLLMPAGPWVELGNDESKDKVFILSLGGENSKLTEPSVMTVFPSLELRRYLQDGEFSASYISKYFIHQIKVGPKNEGTSLRDLLAAKTSGPADKQVVLDKYAKNVDKAFVTVTDQDEEHNFMFPGSDIKFETRYISADKKLLFWGGISLQIMTDSKGGSFSGGLIYMKSFSKTIDAARELIAEILKDVTALMGIEDASFKWNQNYMKEPKQVLAEVTFMTSRGQDMEMAIAQLGYDWSEWIAKREKTLSPEILAFKSDKEQEHKYWQALQIPFFEDHQGQLDEGGRPEDDGTQTDPSNTETTPRAGL